MLSLAATLARRFQASLASHPIRTNAASATVIMATGDAAAQFIEQRYLTRRAAPPAPLQVDVRRTCVMTAWVATIFTPTYHYLYRAMEYGCGPARTVFNSTRKSIFVILCGGPLVNSVLLTVSTHAERLLFQQPATCEEANELIVHKLTHDVPRLLQSSLCFWGPLNVVNFTLLPPHLRLLFSSAAAVVWNTYLSVVAHEHLQQTKPPETAVATGGDVAHKGAGGAAGGAGSSGAASADPFDLHARFVAPQQADFATALGEIRAGRKRSHWSWYIFPTSPFVVDGTEGGSATSQYYALRDPPPHALEGDQAAAAYLAFESEEGRYLRANYIVMMTAVAEQLEAGTSALDLVGYADEPKLRASLVLFERVSRRVDDGEVEAVCRRALAALDE